MNSKKRRLSEEDAVRALEMLNNKISLGKIARQYGVNKPAILKSINLWNTEEKEIKSDGSRYIMKRGKMIILQRKE